MSKPGRPLPPFLPVAPVRRGLWPWIPVLATAALLSGLLSAASWHLA